MRKLPFNIREATIDDVAALRKLNTKIFESINLACDSDIIPRYAQTKEGLDWMESLVNRSGDGCCFVVESDGKLVGYVSGQKMKQSYRQSRWFEIDNVGVIPEFRGQGAGKQLLAKALDWAGGHGFQKVHAISYANNKVARDFYEREGFAQVDVTYEKDIA